eukprot:COSAG01_NODE_104_length_26171_cov_96.617612_6_plen_211_part_00
MHAFLNKGLAVCYRATTAANRLSSSRRSKLAAAAPRSNAAAMGGPGRQAGRHAAAAAAYDDPQCPSVSKRRQLRPAAASAAHLIRCQVGRLSIAAARIMRRRQRRPPLHGAAWRWRRQGLIEVHTRVWASSLVASASPAAPAPAPCCHDRQGQDYGRHHHCLPVACPHLRARPTLRRPCGCCGVMGNAFIRFSPARRPRQRGLRSCEPPP